MHASIIICCYNSESVIVATLRSLLLQRTEGYDWELIIVDNNCTDQTIHLCKSTWVLSGVPMLFVRETKKGLTYAREAGVRASKGAILIFCDDDNFLPENYVAALLEIFRKNKEVGAAGGAGQEVSSIDIPHWFVKYRSFFACGARSSGVSFVNHLTGAGLGIRRSIYEQLIALPIGQVLSDRKGSSLSSGGDTELTMSVRLLGWKLLHVPDLKFGHFMQPHRLTENYLLGLACGLGQARFALSFYEYALVGTNRLVIWLPWLLLRNAAAYFRGIAFSMIQNTRNDLDYKVKAALYIGIGRSFYTAFKDNELLMPYRRCICLISQRKE